jgi:hypothetical protein
MDDTPAPRPLLTTPPQPVQPTGSAVGRGARWLLFVGVFFVLGILAGMLLFRAGIKLPRNLSPLSLLLFLVVGLWFVTLWHELGHALAARLVNWRLLTIAAGPLALRQTPKGPRLAGNPLSRAWGGFVYAIPRDDHQLRRRRFVFVAGGPVASLLLALLAALMALATSAGVLSFVASMVALLSLAIGVMTLVPHRAEGLTSDGGQMLQLWRGGPRVEQRLAIQLLMTALVGGLRPRDLPDALFDRALTATEPEEAIGAHHLAYWRDLDRGDVAGAAAHLDVVLAQRVAVPPAAQATFAAEAAYLTARHDPTLDAPATAEAWLKLATPRGPADSNYRRAQAAVHLVNGRPDDARTAADDALRLLERAMDVGAAEAEREWLLAMRDDAIAAGSSR